jgi:tellurite resistance protein TerC
VFALDSIPAVLAVTRHPLIVYSSNVMAMLGLRSLYFMLSDAAYRLRYLRSGLAALLVFTASKMVASEWVQVSAGASVAIIAVVLLTTIAASVWLKSTPTPTQDSRARVRHVGPLNSPGSSRLPWVSRNNPKQ